MSGRNTKDLLTPEREEFCRQVALLGKNYTEAYEASHPEGTKNKKAVANLASRESQRPDVRNRIKKLQEESVPKKWKDRKAQVMDDLFADIQAMKEQGDVGWSILAKPTIDTLSKLAGWVDDSSKTLNITNIQNNTIDPQLVSDRSHKVIAAFAKLGIKSVGADTVEV